MLISTDYASQQAKLHATNQYGFAGNLYAPLVGQIIQKLGIDHMLDYGCGSRMSLFHALKKDGLLPPRFKYQAYDPGTGDEELATAPIPAQMVSCIDVLEHIEPEYLDNVLDHIRSLTECITILTIHTGPAQKLLSDGRNAHLTQQPMEWWLPKIWERFDIQTVQVAHENGFYVIAYAKGQVESVEGEKIAEEPKIYLME